MEYKVSKKLPFLGVSEKGVVINFETGRILSNVKPTKAGYLRATVSGDKNRPYFVEISKDYF